MALLGSIKSAVAHESDKRKFSNILGNPSSSVEERADAYNGLMTIANRQDWHWLMSQFEQNLGELNSRVMDKFFAGAATHCRERLLRLVTAEDGIVLASVKAINSFTDFAGAAIFLTHRSLSGLEALGLKEELGAFAEFIHLACESKAANGLIPRKLFESRLRQYLPTDVVEDQEARFQQYISRRPPAASATPAPAKKPVGNGNGKPMKASEGRRPTTPVPTGKFFRPEPLQHDVPIDEEGRAAATRAAGDPEARANHALAIGLAASN